MIPIKDVMSLSKGDIDRELIGHVNTVVMWHFPTSQGVVVITSQDEFLGTHRTVVKRKGEFGGFFCTPNSGKLSYKLMG